LSTCTLVGKKNATRGMQQGLPEKSNLHYWNRLQSGGNQIGRLDFFAIKSN